jgi:hypothetical protein
MSIKIGINDIVDIPGITKVMFGSKQAWPTLPDVKVPLVTSLGGVLYYDVLKATGTGLPSNSPLTDPIIDLLDNYNGDLVNFAGTSSSGYDTSNPAKPFLKFDLTNDHIDSALTGANFPANSFSVYVKAMMVQSGASNALSSIDSATIGGTQCFNMGKNSSNIITFGVTNTVGTRFDAATSGALSAGDYTIIGTFDNSTGAIKLYVYDGSTTNTYTSALTGTRDTPLSICPLTIGASFYNDALLAYFNGGIYSYVLFNNELSAENITDLIAAEV